MIITNPPYWLAFDFVLASLSRARFVAMLLRLNFLSSESRSALMRVDAPDVYVLPNRPSFVASGQTDSIEYAWFVWPEERGRRSGRVQVLATTSAVERRTKTTPVDAPRTDPRHSLRLTDREPKIDASAPNEET